MPVPASRPRIGRYGAYYTKNYTDFREEAYRFLKTIKNKYPPCASSTFKVELEFICKKPKCPSNKYPKGDIDNYAKGPLDSLTYTGMFWEDDIQITHLIASKRYQEEGEDYGINIKITRYAETKRVTKRQKRDA